MLARQVYWDNPTQFNLIRDILPLIEARIIQMLKIKASLLRATPITNNSCRPQKEHKINKHLSCLRVYTYYMALQYYSSSPSNN